MRLLAAPAYPASSVCSAPRTYLRPARRTGYYSPVGAAGRISNRSTLLRGMGSCDLQRYQRLSHGKHSMMIVFPLADGRHAFLALLQVFLTA